MINIKNPNKLLKGGHATLACAVGRWEKLNTKSFLETLTFPTERIAWWTSRIGLVIPTYWLDLIIHRWPIICNFLRVLHLTQFAYPSLLILLSRPALALVPSPDHTFSPRGLLLTATSSARATNYSPVLWDAAISCLSPVRFTMLNALPRKQLLLLLRFVAFSFCVR